MRYAGRIGLVLPFMLAGCAGQTPAGPDRVLPSGLWGGDHVSFTIGATSAAIEFDCAHGTLPAPIALDHRGRFDVSGRLAIEHGGPIREGEELVQRPARYRGTVVDSRMTLAVLLEDSLDFGSYHLTATTPGRLLKCL
jgi:hypothetical protein